MKILYVIHQFFPEWYTGTERLTLNLAKQMQKMGHVVEVITYSTIDDSSYSTLKDFVCKRYNFQGIPVISIKHKQLPLDLNFDIFDESIKVLLKKIITKKKYDLVHVVHPMRMGYVIKFSHSIGLPVVLTLTDFFLMCPKIILFTPEGELCSGNDGLKKKCLEKCYDHFSSDKIERRFIEVKELFESVDYVISGTNFLIKMFKNNKINSNIKLIRFGTDYNTNHPIVKNYSDNSAVTVGYLSTLIPHKGADVLIDAFNKANLENIRLKIYGHYFGEKNYYEKLKSKVNKNSDVQFYGEYKFEELPQILDDIDIVVVPSIWWENSPLILLGALAHKIPVIVSDLGGLTEMIKDGENGFTFEAGNIESLAQVLFKIGKNPEILNELKNNIIYPPRIEEEAFEYELIYSGLIGI